MPFKATDELSRWIMPRVIRRINIDCNAYFMEATRACRFRIYPDDKRQNEIDERLVLAKEFYNLLFLKEQ